ncbi:NTP transferase domain-containing protein [Candidatus Woesearchaeota archaeon]|nr:NTP transferase domain-containing protein [Candidatus Woesearchaeota archaeon]
MKAVVPVAGKGTRLRPHTYTLPKALLHVAGKPILGHILDQIKSLGITEVVLIIGYMSEKVEQYVKESYKDMKFDFALQKERLGLGHAVYTAQKYIKDEPILIIYGDTIFVGDISKGMDTKNDGCIGVKTVADPRRFGIVETKAGKIVKLVEKPDYIKKMPAIVGVNYINNTKLLFEALKRLVEHDIRTRNEYQLTDAFQIMVEKGANLTTFEIDGWFDCGKPETLLETNKYLLAEGHGNWTKIKTQNSVLIPPVFIEKDVVVKNSVIGPYVSVAKGAHIINSIIKNSIINRYAVVENAQLLDSLIGENATVRDILEKLNVGDNSEISYTAE